MVKSVMIEVDETTKSILELLEHRISSGTQSTLESFKTDHHQTLKLLSSQLQLQLQEEGKGWKKEIAKLERKMDDFMQDLEDQLLNGSKSTKELLEDTKLSNEENRKSFEGLHHEMNQLSGVVQAFIQATEKANQDLLNSVNELKGQNLHLITTIGEQLKVIEERLAENSHVNHELQGVLPRVEKELERANLPFYKKFVSKEG